MQCLAWNQRGRRRRPANPRPSRWARSRCLCGRPAVDFALLGGKRSGAALCSTEEITLTQNCQDAVKTGFGGWPLSFPSPGAAGRPASQTRSPCSASWNSKHSSGAWRIPCLRQCTRRTRPIPLMASVCKASPSPAWMLPEGGIVFSTPSSSNNNMSGAPARVP